VLWAAAARGWAMSQRSYANLWRIAWISFDPTYPHRERVTVICAAPLRRRRARRPAPLCNTIIGHECADTRNADSVSELACNRVSFFDAHIPRIRHTNAIPRPRERARRRAVAGESPLPGSVATGQSTATLSPWSNTEYYAPIILRV
jgi:hypothetical protein